MKKYITIIILIGLLWLSVIVGKGGLKVQELSITDEEERLLCSLYVDDERIKDGKLYDYQKECLNKIRFAKDYMSEKYPDYEFEFSSISAGKPSEQVKMIVYEKTSRERIILFVRIDDGKYYCEDTFYSYLITVGYDQMLNNKLKDEGVESALVFSTCPTARGLEINGQLSIDEMLSKELNLRIDTTVYVDGKYSEEEKIEIGNKVEKIIRDFGQYGGHFVRFIPGVLSACDTKEECIEYRKEHSNDEEYYSIQFDTFDVR